VRIDKGAGVTALLEDAEIDVAMYVGDDATDLDAFRALEALAESGRLQQAIRVGVSSEDGPAAIRSEADVVVEGTEGVQELLSILASAE
jgi:trehalose 6-phosphate phosphatase